MTRVPRLVFLAGTAAAALLGCSRDPTGPAPAQIAGNWTYHEVMTDHLQQMVCTDTGTYALVQDGARFSGRFVQTGVCASGSSRFANDGHGSVSEGVVNANAIQFKADSVCGYAGLVAASRTTVTSGRGYCTFDFQGTHFNFDITWDAQKQ
jgi:hypothetical protein